MCFLRYSEFQKKEVINVSDCRCLGNVSDLCFDSCGSIETIIVAESSGWIPFFGCSNEFVIPWNKIVRIGPDVILVDVCENQALKKER